MYVLCVLCVLYILNNNNKYERYIIVRRLWISILCRGISSTHFHSLVLFSSVSLSRVFFFLGFRPFLRYIQNQKKKQPHHHYHLIECWYIRRAQLVGCRRSAASAAAAAVPPRSRLLYAHDRLNFSQIFLQQSTNEERRWWRRIRRDSRESKIRKTRKYKGKMMVMMMKCIWERLSFVCVSI